MDAASDPATESPDGPPLEAEGVVVLHLDPPLVVVSKPSGLLVHRGPDRDRIVAMTVVRDLLGQHVYPVHRLDRGTSGALVMALSSEVARALQGLFSTQRIDKRYVAIVRGITPESGFIDHAIQRRQDGPRVPSQTAFRRLYYTRDPGRYSVVEAAPFTGRRHQIRRHLKHLSHPLIGDVRYGKGEHNRLFRRDFNLHRLALHAHRIAFPHPIDHTPINIQAPIPEDLARALRGLKAPEQLGLDAAWNPRETDPYASGILQAIAEDA